MKRLFLLTALSVGLLSGCIAPLPVNDPAVTEPSTPTTPTTTLDYFAANRDLLAAETQWHQQKPSRYSYTLQRSCFCSPEFTKPIKIEVNGNSVSKATVDGLPLPLERRADALTVEGLFNVVRKALDDKVERLDVRYDPTTGMPLSISIDRSQQIADEEMYYSTSEFKALNNVTKPKAKATKAKSVKKTKKTK